MSKEDDFVFRATEEPVKENAVGGAKDILFITRIDGFLGLSLNKVLAQHHLVAGLDREIEYPKLSGHIPCDLTSNWPIKETMDKLRERFVSVIHLPGYYDYTGGLYSSTPYSLKPDWRSICYRSLHI